jgi:hypothetical protein
MKRVPWILLLLLAALAGCADGGPVGTGISGASAISGNVVEVNAGGGGGGGLGVPVRVSIDEVPGLETTTDEEGNFELSGNFAGSLTVRFTAPDVTAARQFDVPDESNLVLQDVVVSRGGVAVDTVRLLGFYGQITLVDCADRIVLVNDRRPVANQFLVRLSDDTVLGRGDGRAIRCADISPGNLVAIEGAIRFADRTIEAVTLTVGPPRPGQKPPIIELRFRGRAVLVACAGGMLLLDDPNVGRTRLRLAADTMIVDAAQQPIGCAAIHVGDFIQGRGLINTRRPGVVDARFLTVQPAR